MTPTSLASPSNEAPSHGPSSLKKAVAGLTEDTSPVDLGSEICLGGQAAVWSGDTTVLKEENEYVAANDDE